MTHVGIVGLRRGTVPCHHQPKEEGLHPRGKGPYSPCEEDRTYYLLTTTNKPGKMS
jgi:hypothetical protein